MDGRTEGKKKGLKDRRTEGGEEGRKEGLKDRRTEGRKEQKKGGGDEDDIIGIRLSHP
jgi:hypothetical protein